MLMVKTRITDQGVIIVPGSGFEGSISAVQSNTRTASATLGGNDAGVTVISASQGVLTMTLPAVSTSPGSMFIFRSTSPSAHVITSSGDAGNTIVERYSNPAGNITGSHGSSITFPAIAGSSVCLMSDGANWCILGGSGSITIAAGSA